MQIDQDTLDWLLGNAGPIIRYRTRVELLKESDDNKVESLKKDLLSDSLVQSWLGCLRPNIRTHVMHGSKSEAFENAMGKLYEFGLRGGMRILDEKTEPFRRWLAQQTDHPTILPFFRTLVAAFLSMTGYSEEDAVNTWILKRLETLYLFAKKNDFEDIYIPQDTFPSFPKAFRRKPLLNPTLQTEDGSMLPSIHDINAFLHSEPVMEDPQLRSKVETIVDFILGPEYQKLYPGYGVVMLSGRYYSAGWSVHLPGYFKSDVRNDHPYQFPIGPDQSTHPSPLLRLSLMSRSRTAREHAWFKRSLSLLASFGTENGLVSFPRSFLPEKKVGYWVNGNRMALEAGRRGRKAITCESTFRYLEIAVKST
ncbi:MAG: hypothetical protein OEY31_14325 [Candidatus Bathyarchaeota archaeon]|nr:hypothetical protein [Candidatus Bathyarchaeota archaeon]